jgi:hypothetical protein
MDFTAGGSSGVEHVDSWSASSSGRIVFAKDSFTLGSKASISAEVELVEAANLSAGAISGATAGITMVDGTLELTSTAMASNIEYISVETGAFDLANDGRITGKLIKTSGGSVDIGEDSNVSYREVIMRGGSFSAGTKVELTVNEFLQEEGMAGVGSSSIVGVGFLAVEDGSLSVGSGSIGAVEDTEIGKTGVVEIGIGSSITGKEAFLHGKLAGEGLLKWVSSLGSAAK